MAAGEGKGWAKGRTAENDARVARAAATHRGKRYVPRIPAERDRRRKSAPAATNWTDDLAYAVGLIATDGCVADGDHISFVSADLELVEHLLRCLGKRNTASAFRTRTGGTAFRTQIGDVAFCRWLATIGITSRKSLVLGAIDAPDERFVPLVRGLLDGDGSIMNKRALADTGRRPDYFWEYLQTRFVSASQAHIVWLESRIRANLGIGGYVAISRARDGRRPQYTLRFGKRSSLRLLPILYADPTAPRLTRKWRVWADYVARHCQANEIGNIELQQAQVAKLADAHV